jgi:hypothetical protein
MDLTPHELTLDEARDFRAGGPAPAARSHRQQTEGATA